MHEIIHKRLESPSTKTSMWCGLSVHDLYLANNLSVRLLDTEHAKDILRQEIKRGPLSFPGHDAIFRCQWRQVVRDKKDFQEEGYSNSPSLDVFY